VFPFIEGNMQLLQKIANEDTAVMLLLAAELQAAGGGPPGMAAGLVAEASLMRKVTQWSGNIQLWEQAYQTSGNIWNACDLLDAMPDPPILLGTTVAIGLSADPLVSLGLPDQPLNALAVDGSHVRIEGSIWPSINDQEFPITVANRPSAQFVITGADTSAETSGTGGGASVWLLPP
jgi:hypothetical protein